MKTNLLTSLIIITIILAFSFIQAQAFPPNLSKETYNNLMGMDDKDSVVVVLICSNDDADKYVSELKQGIGIKIQGVDGNRIRAKAHIWQIKKILPAGWLDDIELVSNRQLAPALVQKKQEIRMEIECSCLPVDYANQLERLGLRIIEVRDEVVVAEADDRELLSKVGQLSFVMRVVWWNMPDIQEKFSEESMWLLNLPDNEVVEVRLIMAVADISIDDIGLEILEKGDGWVSVRCDIAMLKKILGDNRIIRVFSRKKFDKEGEM